MLISCIPDSSSNLQKNKIKSTEIFNNGLMNDDHPNSIPGQFYFNSFLNWIFSKVSSVAGSKETTPASGESGSTPAEYNENYQAHGDVGETILLRAPDIQVSALFLRSKLRDKLPL